MDEQKKNRIPMPVSPPPPQDPPPSPATVPAWPVDLQRQEFVGYQEQMTRLSPLRRSLFVVMALFFGAVLLAMGAETQIRLHQTDWLAWGLGALSILTGVLLMTVMPRYARYRAGRFYDLIQKSHAGFYGLVRFYPDRVEKELPDGRMVSLPLDGTTLFLEDESMMVFLGQGRVGIVLPARCVTEALAVQARRSADRLPIRNRRFRSRIRPQAQPVQPRTAEQLVCLWEQRIRYTEEELTGILKAQASGRFLRRFPSFLLLAVVCGASFGWGEATPVPAAAAFFGCLVFLAVFNWLIPWARAAAAAEQASEAVGTVTVRLTEDGFSLSSDRQGEQVFPWPLVRHVVDRGDYVQITGKAGELRIPKRCIPDLPEWDRLVTEQREKFKNK